MISVDRSLHRSFKSGQHVAQARPTCRVRIQPGRIVRDFRVLDMVQGPDGPGDFGFINGGLFNGYPWQGTWDDYGDWIDLPMVKGVELDQGFANNGIRSGAVHIDNIFAKCVDGASDEYTELLRGYLSPFLGSNVFGRPHWSDMNEWFDVLNSGLRIRVDQGYGEGDGNRMRTFEGMIDDTDTENRPDIISLTVRDFGALFTDQRVYGENKARDITSPIVFCDRAVWQQKVAEGSLTQHWIIVDDPTDVLKWLFLWCGFKEWEVEKIGSPLKEPITVNQSDYFIDVINKIKSYGNFVFFMRTSQHDDNQAIGVPVFRRSNVTERENEVLEVTEHDLLLDMKAKFKKESLARSITTRGKLVVAPAVGGVSWEQDLTVRYTASYTPPWATENNNRTAGNWKHLVHTDQHLESVEECQMANILTAIALAREAFTGECEIPGYPALELDDHLSVLDTATGANSRLWINRMRSTATYGGENRWRQTLEGALLDFPDMENLIQEYQQLLDRIEAAGGVSA